MENRNRIIGLSATIITMVLGIMVMTGWYLHNNFLTEIVPGQAKMKFNVALAFVFSSIVLLFCYFPVKNKIRYPVSVVLSIIISLIGVLTLSEYVFSYNLGIDELFVNDKLPLTASYYPGRMSPISAVNFVLIGTGLFLLNKEKTAIYQFCYLSVIAFFAFLLLVGFNLVSNIPAFIRLAIHVAFGFITLPIGIYFAQPILQQKITFNYRLIAGFIAIFIFLSIFAALSNYYSEERTATFSLIESTDRMLSEAEQTYSLVNDFESDCRGYIITGDSIFLRNFAPAGDIISSHLKKLKEFTKNNFLLESTVDSLTILVNKQINFLRQTVHLKNEKRFGSARKMERTGKGLVLHGSDQEPDYKVPNGRK